MYDNVKKSPFHSHQKLLPNQPITKPGDMFPAQTLQNIVRNGS